MCLVFPFSNVVKQNKSFTSIIQIYFPCLRIKKGVLLVHASVYHVPCNATRGADRTTLRRRLWPLTPHASDLLTATAVSSHTMAGSHVFIVVLVVIFVGFICMLVSLRQSQSEKPEYDDDDDDDNSNSTDVLVDLSKPYITSCDACPLRSLRDMFCDPESFVVVCGVSNVAGSYWRRDRMYIIKLRSQLKQFPDVNSSSIGKESSILHHILHDSCTSYLRSGRDYLLTGRINGSGLATITPCDVAIDWGALPYDNRHSLFSFFSPRLRC